MAIGPRQKQRRSEARIRTRLRTGVISDLQQSFICECLIYDRSLHGARLKLPPNIHAPGTFIFDDGEGAVRAQVRWRRDAEIGIFIAAGK